MRLVYILILSCITVLILMPIVLGIKNPAAVYCAELGYQYQIKPAPEGQIGYCVINGTEYNAWDFFTGKVAKEYSYCSKIGYETITMTDGMNPYSPFYSACVVTETPAGSGPSLNGTNQLTKSSSQKIVPVIDLMHLRDLVREDDQLHPSKAALVQQESPSDLAKSTALPSSFDWRDYQGSNWISSTKDQGQCGSCWAFASVGAVEANYRIENQQASANIDLSEEFIVSCSGAGSCDGGSPSGALDFIRTTGVTDEDCLTYPWQAAFYGYSRPCSDRCPDWENRLWKIGAWDYVAHSTDAIKRALIEEGPLVVTLYVDGGWWDSNGLYKCDINQNSGLHAVVLIGYNDVDRYWIVQNSWGWLGNLLNGVKVGYDQCGLGSLQVLSVRAKDPQCISSSDCQHLNRDYCLGNSVWRQQPYCYKYDCYSNYYFIQNCNDGLSCNGQEGCSNGVCTQGTPIDCSFNDISGVSSCYNVPDSNPGTWDYRKQFTSQCSEPGICTTGNYTISHQCTMSCDAECENDGFCQGGLCIQGSGGCVGHDYYEYPTRPRRCLDDCTCEKKISCTPVVYFDDPRCMKCKFTSDIKGIYNSTRVPISLSCSEQVSDISYSLNGRNFVSLCKNCGSYNRLLNMLEGQNNLKIRATDYAKKTSNLTAAFVVDSRKPVISKIDPSRGYAKGVYLVSYTENNCKSLTLTVGNNLHQAATVLPCPSGKVNALPIFQDSSPFEGEVVDYSFTIMDIANNTDTETAKKLKVDTIPPKVVYQKIQRSDKYVTVNISIGEKGDIGYIDFGDRTPRDRNLCSNCFDYGWKRQGKLTFYRGWHNVSFFVKDYAENRAVVGSGLVFVVK